MNEKKNYAALSPYPSDDFSIMVTGGLGDRQASNKFEVWKDNSWHLSTIGLPRSVAAHCMVQIDSKTVMLIGGGVKASFEYYAFPETYFFNGDTEQWIEGPVMQEGRSGLGCGRIKTSQSQPYFSTIVVGGDDGYNYLSTVEILDDINGKWRYGPSIPVPLRYGRLVEDPAGGIILTGGEVQESPSYNSLYRLSHAGPDATWIEMPQKLQYTRAAHVAILVPVEITNCTLKSNLL